MTIAFQAFVVVLFILPGALFFSALTGRLSAERELPLISASITWAAVVSLIVAVIFHLVWQGAIVTLAKVASLNVESGVAVVFTLLSFSEQSKEYAAALRIFRDNLGYMTVYFLSICLTALASGRLLNYLVGLYRLERTYRWLRFRPRWHYLLAGDDYEGAGDGNVTVVVDLLTEIDGKPLLYSGFVTKYWFDQATDALDIILIAGAKRQWMKSLSMEDAERLWMKLYVKSSEPAEPATDKESGQESVTSLPSHTFAVKFSEVKNINIKYIVTER